MDGWDPRVGRGCSRQAQAGHGNEQDTEGDLLQTSTKLVLSMASQQAIIAGVVFTTYFVPEARESLGAMRAKIGTDYDAETKALKEKQKGGEQVDFKARGPCHIQVFVKTMVRAVQMTAPNAAKAQPEVHAVLRAYFQQHIHEKKPDYIMVDVLHF